MLKAILFDLDGTLLPMDIDTFTHGYFRGLAKKAAPLGYEPKKLVDGIWYGTGAMVRNDGHCTNEEAFWEAFSAFYGRDARADSPVFDEFYGNEFREAVVFASPNPEKAQQAVRLARSKAQKVILATNPIFPASGVRTRLGWLGLSFADFDDVTSYETSHYCKPNPDYFREILTAHSLAPEACCMIGNDVQEDVEPAAALGMSSFLVTDCVINRAPTLPDVPQGSFDELLAFLAQL